MQTYKQKWDKKNFEKKNLKNFFEKKNLKNFIISNRTYSFLFIKYDAKQCEIISETLQKTFFASFFSISKFDQNSFSTNRFEIVLNSTLFLINAFVSIQTTIAKKRNRFKREIFFDVCRKQLALEYWRWIEIFDLFDTATNGTPTNHHENTLKITQSHKTKRATRPETSHQHPGHWIEIFDLFDTATNGTPTNHHENTLKITQSHKTKRATRPETSHQHPGQNWFAKICNLWRNQKHPRKLSAYHTTTLNHNWK